MLNKERWPPITNIPQEDSNLNWYIKPIPRIMCRQMIYKSTCLWAIKPHESEQNNLPVQEDAVSKKHPLAESILRKQSKHGERVLKACPQFPSILGWPNHDLSLSLFLVWISFFLPFNGERSQSLRYTCVSENITLSGDGFSRADLADILAYLNEVCSFYFSSSNKEHTITCKRRETSAQLSGCLGFSLNNLLHMRFYAQHCTASVQARYGFSFSFSKRSTQHFGKEVARRI